MNFFKGEVVGECEINPVFMPIEYGIKREIFSRVSHLDGLPLSDEDLAGYDFYTIFYDVFLDFDNRNLCFIGPPFLNFKKYIFPLEIRFNGELIRRLRRCDDKLQIFMVQIPLDSAKICAENTVELKFGNFFVKKVNVAENVCGRGGALLATLQKDNDIKWIDDWVFYYKQKFLVDTVIIYDNGSKRSNFKDMNATDVTVVKWDFSYGTLKSHDNQFCQLGMLNHVRLKYGGAKFIFNFDIDELLYLKKGITDFLQKYDVVYFDSYWVPNFTENKSLVTFSDFSLVENSPRGEAFKYIYKPDKVSFNKVHSVLPAKFVFLHLLRERLMSVCNNRIFRRKIIDLLDFFSPSKIVRLDDSLGFFLHYKGITTNWKKAYWDRSVFEGNVEDYLSLKDFLKKMR